MRAARLVGILALLCASPVSAQSIIPIPSPSTSADLSNVATKAELAATEAKAAAAKAAADAAAAALATAPTTSSVASAISSATAPLATKSEVTAATTGIVKTVNGATPNTSGAVTLSIPVPPDLTGYATTSSVAGAISSATSNLATKSEVTAADNVVKAAIPTPSATMPPSVADSGAAGTMTMVYALANHTHASKARKDRILVPISGTFDVSFIPAFSASPRCVSTAITTLGDTDVVNTQFDGTPTASSARLRVTRTRSVLGILNLIANTATSVDYICIEP